MSRCLRNAQPSLILLCAVMFTLIETVVAQNVVNTTDNSIRAYSSLFIWNDSLLAYGGVENYAPGINAESTALVYNFTTHTWNKTVYNVSLADKEPLSYSPSLAAHTTHVVSARVALHMFGMISIPIETPGSWEPSKTAFSAFVYSLDLVSMTSSVFTTIPMIGQDNAPSPRSRHASVWDASSGVIWVFGGYSSFGALTDMWSLTVSSGVWTRMPDAPGGVAGVASIASSMVLLGTDIVVACGNRGPESTATNGFFRFDTKSHIWSSLNSSGPMPTSRSFSSMAATTNTTALIYSGRSNSSTPVADSWMLRLDAQKNTLQFASLPFQSANPPFLPDRAAKIPTPRESASIVSDASGNIIVFGGHTGQTRPTDGSIYIFSGSEWIDPASFKIGQASNPSKISFDGSQTTVPRTVPPSATDGITTPADAATQDESWVFSTAFIAITIALTCILVALACLFGAIYMYRARKIRMHTEEARSRQPDDPMVSQPGRTSTTYLAESRRSILGDDDTQPLYMHVARPRTSVAQPPQSTTPSDMEPHSERTLQNPTPNSLIMEYNQAPPAAPQLSLAPWSSASIARNVGAYTLSPVVESDERRSRPINNMPEGSQPILATSKPDRVSHMRPDQHNPYFNPNMPKPTRHTPTSEVSSPAARSTLPIFIESHPVPSGSANLSPHDNVTPQQYYYAYSNDGGSSDASHRSFQSPH
ncbi:hypothetical protein BASA60_003826 [Batrachochytrium salamandrivorans]|nr:hypothetical protein BASA60_003826 [Batrachochytrium salamandrivorans]